LPPATARKPGHRIAQKRWKLRLGNHWKDQALIFANETGGLLDGQNVVN
jgi:hypothetical protein